MKLQRYEKELAGLKDRIKLLEELIEKEKADKNDGYPKIGETYYYVYQDYTETEVNAYPATWSDSTVDKYYWNFRHGSTDKAKVEWTIKHIELVNEIKKYTRPFKNTHANWYFVESHYTQFAKEKTTINIFETSVHDHNSEYGYFDFEEDGKNVIEQFGEDYILKFLFHPVDGNYKAVMDWLAEQEEMQ